MKRLFFAILALTLAALLAFTGCGLRDAVSGTQANGGAAAPAGETAQPGISTQNGETAAPVETTSAAPTTTAQALKDEKLIALTFDDGPYAPTTNRILDTLEANHAHATFFVCGDHLGEKGAEVIKRQVALGCEVGNHTKNHKTLTKLSAAGVAEQVNWVNDRVKEIADYDVKLLRAPGGAYKGVLNQVNMPFIQWSVDTNDWRWKDEAHKGRTPEERAAKMQEIADMVLDTAEAGDIVLMHDIYDFTADLAAIVIPGLAAKGFKMVTVSEMYAAYGETLKPSTIYFNIDRTPAAAEEEPADPLPAGTYIINTKNDPLNIRADAKPAGALLGKVPKGTTVTVTESVPGWSYITYDGVSGWVNAKFLKAVA